MHRTRFGEARPNNHEDMVEALMELDYCFEGGGSHARLQPPDPSNVDTVFQGWTADAVDDFGVEFSTAGYPERDAIVADLRAAGFVTFEDMV